MAWTYDASDLDVTTASGRLNVVRYLVGDTSTLDQQIQDEEITFGLSENNDNVYRTAAWVSRSIAAKYSRYVDIELDGQVSEKYSQLSEHYRLLAIDLSAQAKSSGTNSLAFAGGINCTEMTLNRNSPTRPKGFYIGQFDNKVEE